MVFDVSMSPTVLTCPPVQLSDPALIAGTDAGSAERDGQVQGEDHLDLLLVALVRVVVIGAQAAGEGVGSVVRRGARAGGDGQRTAARALRGHEVVGLGD